MTAAHHPQPDALAQTLHRLPPHPGDAGGMAERTGLWQQGGRLTIGLDTSLADLAHSSLIRAGAVCLAEAARFDQSRGEISLAASLRPDLAPSSGLALALVALAAEIEIARLQPDQTVARSWQPIATFLANPPPPPSLPLAVQMAAGEDIRGSAFVPAPAVRGASATLRAAAAALGLAADGTVATAAVALLPLSGPLFAVETASLLVGHPIGPDRLAAAARQAQIDAQTRLGPALAPPAFPIQVAAHLVRKALDRAAARCLARLEAGA